MGSEVEGERWREDRVVERGQEGNGKEGRGRGESGRRNRGEQERGGEGKRGREGVSGLRKRGQGVECNHRDPRLLSACCGPAAETRASGVLSPVILTPTTSG